jgi:hypothetical protein
MEGWTPARTWDEAPPPMRMRRPSTGVHRQGRDFNMHARLAELQAIHRGQPEPG